MHDSITQLMNSCGGQRCEPLSKGASRYGPSSVTFERAISAVLRWPLDDNNSDRVISRANVDPDEIEKSIDRSTSVRARARATMPNADLV